MPGKLPQVKGAISPLERKEKDLLIGAGLGAIHSRAPQGINGAIGQGLAPERSLERNQSVLSRKELIKQEYNLLLETRLPNIMQIMNSEKSLGLQVNAAANGQYDYALPKNADAAPESGGDQEEPNLAGRIRNHRDRVHSSTVNNKQFGKQSVDYDDTDFLQKMFSNGDKDIRNLSKNSGHQHSLNTIGV